MASVDCPKCGLSFDVKPRSSKWTGRFRTALKCPHCQFEFGWKPLPNGVEPDQVKVELHTSSDGERVFIEQYEVPLEKTRRFTDAWKSSWERVPSAVARLLDSHWNQQNGEPHIWLLNDRNEWCGKGWAATKDSGRSFFFLGGVIADLPQATLEIMIAHELGHAVCIATGEENHVTAAPTTETRLKCEFLVWRLIESWGFDQRELDAWMEINFRDDGQVVALRDPPLAIAPAETTALMKRREVEAALSQFQFPSVLKPYLGS